MVDESRCGFVTIRSLINKMLSTERGEPISTKREYVSTSNPLSVRVLRQIEAAFVAQQTQPHYQ